jgi:hypothetical protein
MQLKTKTPNFDKDSLHSQGSVTVTEQHFGVDVVLAPPKQTEVFNIEWVDEKLAECPCQVFLKNFD